MAEYRRYIEACDLAEVIKNLDIRVDEACSRIDKYGRMTLEFKIKKTHGCWL